MERGGFLDTSKPNPIGLGLIVAAHAAVLAAIILSPPETFEKITFLPTIARQIPDDPVPPEAPPPPQSHARQMRPVETPTLIKPIIPSTGVDPVNFTDQSTFQNAGPIAPVIPLKPDPVIVGATPDPAAAGRFQPDYPLSLARAGTEGMATVRVLIGADGRVKQVEMVSATDPAFFDATRKQALRYWRFRPATSDGNPIEAWRTMTVRFRMQS